MADRAKFYTDTPFVALKRVDDGASGDLVLKGYASTWTLDRDQEYVERDAFEGTVEKFVRTNPILLWQHDLERPIGSVKSMTVDDNGLDVECYVPRPDDKEPDWAHLAYNKMKAGIVKTFSIGGFFERMQKGAKRAITKVDLFEVSVVSVPSNPDSIFAAAVKSIEGSARPELTTAHTQQMAQLLGMKPITDPEIALMDKEEKQARYEFLAAIYRKTGKRPPSLDAWSKVLDAKGKPAPERLGLVLNVMNEVDGKLIAERTSVSVSKDIPSDATLDRMERVIGDVKEALASGDDQKRGRVLSRENERRLREMRNEIDAILAQLHRDDDDENHDDTEGDGSATTVERRSADVEALEDDLALGDDERLVDGFIERSSEDKTWTATYPVLDAKVKPTNLRAAKGDPDGDGIPDACATCQFWRQPGGKAPDKTDARRGWCRKFNFPTRGNQLSDGYAAAKTSKDGGGNA